MVIYNMVLEEVEREIKQKLLESIKQLKGNR